MTVALAIAVFAVAFATDLVWVRCVRAVQANSRARAVLWTVTLGALSTAGMLVVVHDWVYLFPDLAGLAAGTWCAMRDNKGAT